MTVADQTPTPQPDCSAAEALDGALAHLINRTRCNLITEPPADTVRSTLAELGWEVRLVPVGGQPHPNQPNATAVVDGRRAPDVVTTPAWADGPRLVFPLPTGGVRVQPCSKTGKWNSVVPVAFDLTDDEARRFAVMLWSAVGGQPQPDSPPDLAAIAADIESNLRAAGFDAEHAATRQILGLAEEAGECVGAFRRWQGLARRTGTKAEFEAELADVVITAFVTAAAVDVDLYAAIQAKVDVIFSRGWRQ